jgi:hypothetical protein
MLTVLRERTRYVDSGLMQAGRKNAFSALRHAIARVILLQYVIGRRNYAIARMDAATRDLIIDIRLEIVQGEGNTKP